MADNETTIRETSLSSGRHVLGRPWQGRYGVAVLYMVLGWLAREALSPAVGPTALPFIFFFPAVALAAWFGGCGPGMLAVGLGTLGAFYFFIEPVRTFSVRGWPDVVTLLAFPFSCAFIIAAIEAMHRARRHLVSEIVQRERVTTELAHARDSLAITLGSIGDGVIVTDADGAITFLNPEAERLTRWTNRDAIGRSANEVFRIVNEYTREPAESPVDRVLRSGRTVGLANHTLLVGQDGVETPIDDSAAPIRPREGAPVGVVLVFRDVMEQRRAEKARTRLAAIVEFSGDAIFTKSLEGIIESWNVGAERLFGYRAEEIIGQSITRLVPPEHLGEEHEILHRLREGLPSERIETVRLAKDGRKLVVSVSVSPLRDREGRVVGASTIMHDVSQRKEAEAALAETRERLVAELKGMQRLHELGTLLLKETGLSAMLRQVLAASVELLRADKGNVQLYDAEANKLRIVAQVGFDQESLQPLLAVTPTDDWCSGLALAKKQRVIIEDISRDPHFAHLQPIAEAHGFVAIQSTPLIGGDGEVFGILATHFRQPHRPSESELRLLDLYAHQAERLIDRHRAAEAIREAQAKLAQANASLERTVQERTAALQDMVSELQHVSYAITHDMRAPLRAMSSFAQLLLEEAADHNLTPAAKGYCERIVTGAGRLDTLIRDALNYTRAVLQQLPMSAVDLDTLVRGMIDTYPNLGPEKADIEIKDRLPVVHGNEALLTQCFSNLLGNAVKFVAPDRKPRVTIWANRSTTVAQISVKDNGIGIPRHAQARLFGMFQKLDNRFEGTGIGLAIVRKVVERMGGKVGVDSEAGEGSRFWVELPLADPEAKA